MSANSQAGGPTSESPRQAIAWKRWIMVVLVAVLGVAAIAIAMTRDGENAEETWERSIRTDLDERWESASAEEHLDWCAKDWLSAALDTEPGVLGMDPRAAIIHDEFYLQKCTDDIVDEAASEALAETWQAFSSENRIEFCDSFNDNPRALWERLWENSTGNLLNYLGFERFKSFWELEC